jgi:hypothetical protein
MWSNHLNFKFKDAFWNLKATDLVDITSDFEGCSVHKATAYTDGTFSTVVDISSATYSNPLAVYKPNNPVERDVSDGSINLEFATYGSTLLAAPAAMYTEFQSNSISNAAVSTKLLIKFLSCKDLELSVSGTNPRNLTYF